MNNEFSKFINCEHDNEDVINFLTEVMAVCKKHNMSIGHECNDGDFMVEGYSEESMLWLGQCYSDV